MSAGVAHHRRRRDHAADFQRPPAARPVIENLADVFMARHDDAAEVEIRIRPPVPLRHLDHLAAEMYEMGVRRAQATAVRAHQRLTLPRHRVGHFADANVMVLKIGGFHDASRGCAAWSCPNTAYDGSERSRRPTSCSYIAVTSRISSKSRSGSRA